MKPLRHLIPAIVAALIGGAIAFAGTESTVQRHTNRLRFDLADLYRAGAVAGAGATGLAIVVGLAIGRKADPRGDVIRFLEAQTGREDLSDDQRAALAYVAQDLRDSASDAQRSKGFKTFDS